MSAKATASSFPTAEAATVEGVGEESAGAASGLSPAARRYALAELLKRAGFEDGSDSDEIESIDYGSEYTEIRFRRERTRLRIAHCAQASLEALREGKFRTQRIPWPRAPVIPSLGERTKEVVIPFDFSFEGESGGKRKSLLREVDEGSWECPFDLLVSIFFTLTRLEEELEGRRDKHDRFPMERSVAWRDGYLERPVLDELGRAFADELMLARPGWKPCFPEFRVLITHDVDEVGMDFSLRRLLGHLAVRRRPLAALRDGLAVPVGLHSSYLHALHSMVLAAAERNFRSHVYWKASPKGPFDSGYDLGAPSLRRIRRRLLAEGAGFGAHPGYATHGDGAALERELAELRRVLGEKLAGGRQHYLRWSPRSWLAWERAGLRYDSSVGFAEAPGFRAGTAHPYRPWLLGEQRVADLWEVPLIVMDTTLKEYRKLDREQAIARVGELAARCRAVGGVFTLLWHSNTDIDRRYRGAFEAALDAIGPGRSFSVEALR